MATLEFNSEVGSYGGTRCTINFEVGKDEGRLTQEEYKSLMDAIAVIESLAINYGAIKEEKK